MWGQEFLSKRMGDFLGMTKADKDEFTTEYERLSKLFADIPPNKRDLVDGLLDQAARHRVTLNECWTDIVKNGRTEVRRKTNGEEAEVERDISKIFTATDRAYQSIMKILAELLPSSSGGSKLDAFLNNNED